MSGVRVPEADRLKARDLMLVKLADETKSWMSEEDLRCVDVTKFREIRWCQVGKHLKSEE